MKGGFAMLSLAIDALRRVDPDAIGGPLRFLSVIEEECTGNGTLASCLAGQLADAVVLAEPTGLDLLLAGVGILWLEIAIVGKAAHAQSANEAINPIDEAIPVIGALRALERAMNDDVDDPALEVKTIRTTSTSGRSAPATGRRAFRRSRDSTSGSAIRPHGRPMRPRNTCDPPSWTPPAAIAGS